jgi:hypothetical protein
MSRNVELLMVGAASSMLTAFSSAEALCLPSYVQIVRQSLKALLIKHYLGSFLSTLTN